MKILIVDDVEINRDLLVEFLHEEYEILTAENGEDALHILQTEQKPMDLVLLDLAMPEIDGFEVLNRMKKQGLLERTPVIVISGENITEFEKKSLNLGAVDFIRKPFDKYIVKRRVKNTLELFRCRRSLEKRVEHQSILLQEKNEHLRKQSEKIKSNNQKIIDVLGTVVEYRNLESGMHIRRVKEFTRILANAMMQMFPEYHLNEKKVEIIAAASPLHDIGKICISDQILLKPGRLTKEEFDEMKTHTTRGSVLLENIQGAWDREYGQICYEICRFHHERADGKGYPDGLRGEKIPISAQIVSVADVYDALTSKRCYKDAYSLEKATQMILAGECGVFSKKLMLCFVHERKKIRRDCEKIYLKGGSALAHSEESNYERVFRQFQQWFLESNHEQTAKLLELRMDEQFLYVPFFGELCLVNRNSGTIQSAEKRELPVSERLTIFHHLHYCRQTAQKSTKKIAFREVREAAVFESAYRKAALLPLVQAFSGSPEKLLEAGLALGGKQEAFADVSVTLKAFPKIELTYLFWDADEEFPASANILFDDKIAQWTHPESVPVLAELGTKRLLEKATKNAS